MKKLFFIALILSLLSSCGGSDNETANEAESTDGCDISSNDPKGVQWSLLLERNCQLLSSYQLFEDASETRRSPKIPGIAFDLAIPLFTDYANKYRFVFVPEGQSVIYNEDDTFDFPIGTVFVKTFALPNANKSSTSEEVIETRLLIHRQKGWVALPYLWQLNEKGEREARLILEGKRITSTLIQDGKEEQFEYEVPSIGECKTCHLTREPDVIEPSKTIAKFLPIGLKARHLNRNILTPDMGNINQLGYWQAKSLLKQLPQFGVDQIPLWKSQSSDYPQWTDNEYLFKKAKGYLDINCAHCHNPTGSGEESGMFLEYWRVLEGAKHGVCKRPGGFNGGDLGLHYDIVPGNADASILPYRMSLLARLGDNKGQMPPMTRNLNHTEGIELIRSWIDSLPLQDCSR